MTVRVHGKKPYRAVVVHGGPGAIGSAAGLAKGLAEYCGVMEPLQSEHTVNGQKNSKGRSPLSMGEALLC